MMDRSLLVRAAGLYVPILLATGLGRARMQTKRHVAAILAGLCWCLPALLVLQLCNLRLHWWTFHAQGGLLRGMPVDLYLGWAVLWGVAPVLSFPRQALWRTIGFLAALDLVLMPACAPVVQLSHRWLIGEFAAIVLVLAPAQLFSLWTWHATHLHRRALLWVIAFSAVIFFLLPETVFAITRRGDWRPLAATTSWTRSLARSLELQLVAVMGVMALSAAQDFARRGLGTPIPFDPPQRLVIAGLYRYMAGPMQTSGALALTAWGLLLRSPWLAVAGPLTFIYGAGLAHWHEDEDMCTRFGEAWLRYRHHVPIWRPRWKPWHDPDSPRPRLYIASGCGPCSEVRRWFEGRVPLALDIVAAEDHPTRDLTRITYDPMDGTAADEGVAALARGLEHINFGWAFLGACLRLPGVRALAQLVADASGFGPQLIQRRSCTIG
jgi:protein-S-isoprenylcysteine O-methyltransferase Ste14